MANTSCWYIPPEYGKIERLIEETGLLPVRRGREEVLSGVPQREYRFRTVRDCTYLMFRMYGWYYGQARGARFPMRHYEWRGDIPQGKVVVTDRNQRSGEKKMATYYAMSTENFAMCGMSLVGVGATKAEAEERAIETLGPRTTDMRSDTWYKNLRVVSKSEATRNGWVNHQSIQEYLDLRELVEQGPVI